MSTVSLKDIADELRVSTSLVSKVLNDRLGTSRVTPELSRAIHARARQLGYRKNRTAAALATGRHSVIGVFIHHVGSRGSGITEELIQGLSEAARRHRQRLWLNFYITDDDFRQLCPDAHAGEIDGLIVGGVAHRQLIDHLMGQRSRGIPIITVHDTVLDPRLSNVGTDQLRIGELATEHLIECGCRRLAVLVAEEAECHRTDGFRRAMTAHGMPVIQELVVQCADYEYGSGTEAAHQLLASGVPFDGIVAQSDAMAAGAMHALCRAGRRVPEDVRIIGVDNSPVCETALVPLTSIEQGFRRRGEQAIEMMLLQIAGESAASTIVNPTLVRRESTR